MENKNILAANSGQNTQNTGATPPATAPQAAQAGIQPQVTAQPQAASALPSLPPVVPAEPIGNALNGGGKLAFLKNKRFQMWLSIIGIAVVIAGTVSIVITRQSGLYRATLDQDSGSLTEKFQGDISRAGEGEECEGIKIKIKNWNPADLTSLINKIAEFYQPIIENNSEGQFVAIPNNEVLRLLPLLPIDSTYARAINLQKGNVHLNENFQNPLVRLNTGTRRTDGDQPVDDGDQPVDDGDQPVDDGDQPVDDGDQLQFNINAYMEAFKVDLNTELSVIANPAETFLTIEFPPVNAEDPDLLSLNADEAKTIIQELRNIETHPNLEVRTALLPEGCSECQNDDECDEGNVCEINEGLVAAGLCIPTVAEDGVVVEGEEPVVTEDENEVAEGEITEAEKTKICNFAALSYTLLGQSDLKGNNRSTVQTFVTDKVQAAQCPNLTAPTLPELPSEAGALKRAQCEGIKRAGELLKKSGISAEQYAALIAPYRTQANELTCPAELIPAGTLTSFRLVDNAYAAAGDACDINYYLLLGLLNESNFLEDEYNSKYDLLKQMAQTALPECAFPAKPANKECLPAETTALEEKLAVLNENTNNLEEAALQQAFTALQEEFHSFGCKSPLAEALNPVERAPEEPETPEEQCEAIIDAVREISAETVEEYNEAYAEQVVKVAELVRAGSQCEIPEPTPPEVTPARVNTGASECTAQELQDVTSLFNMLTQGPTVGSAYMQVYNQLKAQAQSQGCGDKVPAVPVGRDQEPAPDTDKDGIPDSQDACKDKAGVASADLKKNGCPAESANLYDLVATTPRAGQTGTTTGTGATGQVQPVQPAQPSGNQTGTAGTVRTTGQAQIPAGNTTPNLGNTYRYSPVTSYGQQIGGGTGPGMLAYLFIPLGANALWFARRKLKK